MSSTKAYVIKDFHNHYRGLIENGTVYDVELSVYRNVLVDYFKYLRDSVIEEGRDVKFPCRLGRFYIIKHKPKTLTKQSLKVDFKTTRELGKIIYHLNEHSDGFKYRFFWQKTNSMIKNQVKYMFIWARDNKRRLAQIIKNKEHDYIEI